MPDSSVSGNKIDCPIQQHFHVKASNLPNFMCRRTPVVSQLHVDEWKASLADYWNQQLLLLIQYGFPLDFDRNCPLYSEFKNHASAIDFPNDVVTYLDEEIQHGAIIGPFETSPIPECHFSPFMTRHKPNSANRRVIVDLSWPHENSVNDGVDKSVYLGIQFSLSFPSVDHITDEVCRIGKGAHLYKIDISRAFRHLKIDSHDYDLLGLCWQKAFIDTCLPFGSKHGSQNFQRLSNAVCHIMHQHGYDVINYIDDFIGFGTPEVARNSYDCLYKILQKLGLTISEKKLVPPGTRVTCLGVLIDTENVTISIPHEKLQEICSTVQEWSDKKSCSKRQLQSLLGQLLYVHKCVRLARLFLNRMLQLLRDNYLEKTIALTAEFKRDLQWFKKVLKIFNITSIYNHSVIRHTVELDACLTGFGAVSGNYVYHLSIERGYGNLNIVHLEMLNILLAFRAFSPCWTMKRLLIKCDNDAVVKVLNTGHAYDPFLGACAKNKWFQAALMEIDAKYVHVPGVNNQTADLVSRWDYSPHSYQKLGRLVDSPVWLDVSYDMLRIDIEI